MSWHTTQPFTPLATIATAPIVYGIVQPGENVSAGVPFVQTRDIGGVLDPAHLDRTTDKIAAAYGRSSLIAGDILIALRGEIGSSALVPESLTGANISRGVARLRVSAQHDPHFVHQVLSSTHVRREIDSLSRGSALREISIGALRTVTIPTPSLPEQRKIAEILRVWDKAIGTTETLSSLKQKRFRYALQRLLSSENWPRVTLGRVTERVVRKNDGRDHLVMTISAKSGFVAQADKYRRDMAGKSAETYTLLRKGEFAYNKGNSLTYPQGCIFPLRQPTALVPSVYVAFRLDPELNANYYEHLFSAGLLNRQLAQRISAGVRNNGLLNINATEFFGIRVPVPPRPEQDRVAKVLDSMTAEIALLDRKIELLRTQKRGLMQKLLTGDVRVIPEVVPEEEQP